MPLTLNFGSVGSVEVAAAGDLSKYLDSGVESLITFAPVVAANISSPIANIPSGSVSTTLNFSVSPSWTVAQTVGITLTVAPEAVCTLSIFKPGDTLLTYTVGEDAQPTSITAPAGSYYVSISLQCSLEVDAGASFSAGQLGISGNISSTDQFTIANYYAVGPSTALRDALSQAFSSFVLPFQADSIQSLSVGDYVDFEFTGKLALGFGATYGFSEMFFGAQSGNEVTASVSTPVGKAVITASPSVQVGASFKLEYTQIGAFRVVTGRTQEGATLYLLHHNSSQITATEDFGITLNAGATFNTDVATLQNETQTAAQHLLGGAAGTALGTKLSALVGQAAGDIDTAVNTLLAKGDGQKIQLELVQSRLRENTALFIYDFDFSAGTAAYETAMKGDYVTALSMPGVDLAPNSYIEQLYTSQSGLSLQVFDLLQFHDVTTYIQRTDVTYLGSRTFQIRQTAGVKTISGLFGKEREADLYFIAQCRNVLQSSAITNLDVRWNAVFIDRNNASAFDETRRTLTALGLPDVANAVQSYVVRNPNGTIQFTLDIPASALGSIDSDDYLPNGKPAPEPHLKDAANYHAFVGSVVAVIGPVDTIAQTFEQGFARYADWLAFNRVVTDQQGSTRPGDRLSEGNTNGDNWPQGYPPADTASRLLVQTYILSGQAFMNFCDSTKNLYRALPGADTAAKFQELYQAVADLIREETPFPTYFLKPSMAALLSLANIQLQVSGTLPDQSTGGSFSFDLQPTIVGAAAAA
jgi:hypothetical protein